MKNMQKAWLLGTIMLSVIGMTSCEKEEELTEPILTPVEDTKGVSNLASLCELENEAHSAYWSLGDAVLGAIPPYNGSLNGYMECITPALPYSGSCCSSSPIVLNGNVFEFWGTGFTQDPLSNGVMSVAEQMDFIARVQAAAVAASPSCSSGWMQPTRYELSHSPITNGLAVHVTVHYSPVCPFSLP